MSAAARFLLLRPRGVSLVNYLRTIAGYFATWPMQELTGTTALADNVALALGRRLNLLTYADYTAGAGWSNSGGEVALHTAGNTATLQQDGILAAGRTYQAKVTVSGRTAGSITITEGGAAISANGQATRTITSTGANFIITPTTDFDGSLDLAVVLVQQTGILDSSAGLGLLDGTYTGVALAQPGAGNVTYVVEGDGIASYVQLPSEVNSTIDFEGAGSIGCAIRNDAWSGTRYFWNLEVDTNNRINMLHVDGSLSFRYQAGSVSSLITIPGMTTTDLILLFLTWDTAANGGLGEFKAYINSAKQGATLTNLGDWVGNVPENLRVLMARTNAPTNAMAGGIAYWEIFTSALPQTTIAQITAAFGVA